MEFCCKMRITCEVSTSNPSRDDGDANFPFVNGRCHLKRSMPFLGTVVAIENG